MIPQHSIHYAVALVVEFHVKYVHKLPTNTCNIRSPMLVQLIICLTGPLDIQNSKKSNHMCSLKTLDWNSVSIKFWKKHNFSTYFGFYNQLSFHHRRCLQAIVYLLRTSPTNRSELFEVRVNSGFNRKSILILSWWKIHR